MEMLVTSNKEETTSEGKIFFEAVSVRHFLNDANVEEIC